jgi:hypothetical protein
MEGLAALAGGSQIPAAFQQNNDFFSRPVANLALAGMPAGRASYFSYEKTIRHSRT